MAKKSETEETPKPAAPQGAAAPAAEVDSATKDATGGGSGAENQGGAAADKGSDNKKPKPVKKVPGLRIKAKAKSFRRAGLVFSDQPTDVLLSELSKDQVAALKAEPMLVAEEIEIEAEG
jgi:hypothetical protein